MAVVAVILMGQSPAPAHSPTMDADLSDWCFGAFSNTVSGGGRVEDSAANLVCGECSVTSDQACEVDGDCPGAETCVNLTSKVEDVWWDNRTDGAVNDLGSLAFTQDNENLYIAAELWVDPDPESLPFGLLAIDWEQGGLNTFHDPLANMITPGTCSGFTDRACTTDVDCHFCAISTEPFPSTRLRACGSGCNPDIPEDVCMMDQTCEDLGAGGLAANVGLNGGPAGKADYLLVFDFSFWLTSAGDAVLLMEPGTTADPTSPWDPVFGCTPDFVGDDTRCDAAPAVNPGASGGSGGPPGSVEVAIPWSAFGCTGCPAACSCPGFGPGVPFRSTLTVARGNVTLDFRVDGAIEDVVSEVSAGTTTTTATSCPGMGIGTTACEIADNSSDALFPLTTLNHESVAGGTIFGLTMDKGAGANVTLNWGSSCSVADSDYGVYEGTIGTWYNHTQVPGFCSTGGATTATFGAAAANSYYLVVPSGGTTEGSYGADSAGVDRPVGLAACQATQAVNCP